MITKMISALDLRECMEVLKAVELRLLCVESHGDKDYDYSLKDAHSSVEDACAYLKKHYHLSLLDKLALCSYDSAGRLFVASQFR